MAQQASTQAAVACSQCGREFAQSDLVQIAGSWVCGQCKPAFLSRVVAGDASATSRWHYGGFWIRFLAILIDGLIMDAIYIPLAMLFGLTAFRTVGSAPVVRPGTIVALEFVPLLAFFLYEVIMIRYFGATLGKMAVGVKVVRSDGSEISWGISIARYFMKMVSWIILMIGYIMAGFDSEKRALHDRVCDTRVVYKRSLGQA
jgi:uncharacterized RDD family membrane protein YckC